MKTKAAISNQNVWDFTLQEYGSLEPMFEFMAANNLQSLESNLVIHKKYKVPESTKLSRSILKEYVNKDVKVTTGMFPVQGILQEDGQFILIEDNQIITEE